MRSPQHAWKCPHAMMASLEEPGPGGHAGGAGRDSQAPSQAQIRSRDRRFVVSAAIPRIFQGSGTPHPGCGVSRLWQGGRKGRSRGGRGVKERRQPGLCLVWPRRRQREPLHPRGTGHGHSPAALPGAGDTAVPEPGASVPPSSPVGSWGHAECPCKNTVSCRLTTLGTNSAAQLVGPWVTDGFVPHPPHLEGVTFPAPGSVSLHRRGQRGQRVPRSTVTLRDTPCLAGPQRHVPGQRQRPRHRAQPAVPPPGRGQRGLRPPRHPEPPEEAEGEEGRAGLARGRCHLRRGPARPVCHRSAHPGRAAPGTPGHGHSPETPGDLRGWGGDSGTLPRFGGAGDAP